MFWHFMFYSLLGFGLEVVFAALTRGNPHRKCLRILPLCPVYGLGGCSIAYAADALSSPILIFFVGAILATACEYVMAAFYEDVLGARFWDYSDVPLNLRSRVCLPFSVAWGALSIPLVLWLHPRVTALPQPPLPVTVLMLAAFCADFLLSCLLVRQSGTRDCLDW